jgi:hypothetical protein
MSQIAHPEVFVRRDASDSGREHHLPNMTNDFMGRHMTERSIVDESLRQNRGACPSARRPRPVPVRHIDVKVAIPDHLEQRDAAVVRQWPA